ncbi:MAG: hypothetical protein M0Z62_04795 [Actinomycetota bacterium]|nr:hypothetical protein [Actinomycetota bacterium]
MTNARPDRHQTAATTEPPVPEQQRLPLAEAPVGGPIDGRTTTPPVAPPAAGSHATSANPGIDGEDTWRLDERTRRIGLAGVAEARARLARPDAA